jgi:hypothetical protein
MTYLRNINPLYAGSFGKFDHVLVRREEVVTKIKIFFE